MDGLISKKQLCLCSILFCTFLCLCFAQLQHKPLAMCFMEEMLYLFLFTLFHCRSFSHQWPLAFLIFHQRYKSSMFFFPQNWYEIELMTCHYLDLGIASDWLNQISHAVRPIRSNTQIWKSVVVSPKGQLFSQATR